MKAIMFPNYPRVDPFRDLLQLQNSLMYAYETLDRPKTAHSHGEHGAVTGTWQPFMDVFEDQEHIVVKLELAEVPEKDIDLRIDGNTLIVSGERKLDAVERQAYRLIERTYGSFRRAFNLPDSVDAEQVTAESKDGVLSIHLPKRVGSKARSRVFVDDGPLVERDAAVRAGLGFRGKNTNLLTPIGSFVFLGALLTDVELEFDAPITRDCGSCRLCIDACPTDALDQAYHLAAERCIAYLTIEHRGPIAEALRAKVGEWVFGCDICQEVCPYNASTRGRPRGWTEFEPRHGTRLNLERVLEMDDAAFREVFRGSPIKRTRRRGLARNAAIALGNTQPAAAHAALEHAAASDPDAVVREAAEWALMRPRTT